MQADLLEVMCSMLKVQGIQILLFSSEYEDLSRIDYGFREKMYEEYDYLPGLKRINSLMGSGIIYQFEDDLKLYYIAVRFTEELEQEYEVRMAWIGPLLFQPITTSTFQALMEQKKIPYDLHWEVQEFYNRVPLLLNYELWNNTFHFFLSKLCGQPLELRLIHSGEEELFQTAYEDYQIQKVPDVAAKTIEERYALETQMLNAVSAGDTVRALEYHNLFYQYKIVPRTPDRVRDQKNLQFVLNTLLRKAVQAGHVNPLHIDNLSRQFAIQIESCSTAGQLDHITMNMIRKYCMLVKNYSRKAYSSLVQTCMDYIDFHYTDNLSLDFMAKMCSVSNSYLSALFKQEAGITLTDYINSTRIRQSLILLNATSLSIQEIGAQCGFSDSNYFTRTFKKFQGKSPRGYRESIRG